MVKSSLPLSFEHNSNEKKMTKERDSNQSQTQESSSVDDRLIADFFFTSISKEAVQKALRKGMFFASIGAFILVFAGVQLSVQQLGKWGGMLFLIGMGLITWGLLPYRKLSSMQLNPNRMMLNQSLEAVYFIKNQKALSFSIASIASSEWIVDQGIPGILVKFKETLTPPLTIYSGIKEAKKMRKRAKQRKGDIFFPHFSQASFRIWQEWKELVS